MKVFCRLNTNMATSKVQRMVVDEQSYSVAKKEVRYTQK